MQMQQTIDLYSSSLAVQQLSSIGIRLPSAEELLNIAVQCNETQWEAMQAQVVAEGELADRAEYENQLLSNGFVQNTDGTWVAGPNHNSVAQTDPAIHARTMQLILESEGTGTTQQRLSAYAKANGLSREFVAQTTGINVEESVWVASSNFEWVPNVYETIEAHENPTSENTLIVIIYGSNQLIGSSSGFDNLILNLNGNYDNVIKLTPGKNPLAQGEAEILPEPEAAMITIKDSVDQYLINHTEIKNVVIVGHSWGGSAAYELARHLTLKEQTRGTISITGTVYVDAVTNPATSSGDITTFTAENRIPLGTKSMLNIYQSEANNFADYGINGGSLNLSGTQYSNPELRSFKEINLDEHGNFHTHASIDDISVSYILDFIQERITPNN
jgi:hypothetical protein